MTAVDGPTINLRAYALQEPGFDLFHREKRAGPPHKKTGHDIHDIMLFEQHDGNADNYRHDHRDPADDWPLAHAVKRGKKRRRQVHGREQIIRVIDPEVKTDEFRYPVIGHGHLRP